MKPTQQQVNRVEKIISFSICGKFAHFRKFYTNASSLTYLLPPRTALTGLLASILELPRDSYYDTLSPEQAFIASAISPSASIKKSTQSLNMLHDKFFNYLIKGSGSRDNMHTQCKMELLMADPGHKIEYMIYIAMPPENPLFKELIHRLETGNTGYGVYLGQRQFRADIQLQKVFSKSDITALDDAPTLDSACLLENIAQLDESKDTHIVDESSPIHFRSSSPGREPVSIKHICFERSGKSISGHFKNCYRIADKTISFL
jgi:CRISPR-associated protein Cas5h